MEVKAARNAKNVQNDENFKGGLVGSWERLNLPLLHQHGEKKGLALNSNYPSNKSLNLGLGHHILSSAWCIELYTQLSQLVFTRSYLAMSKFGVVVMGPAGAGKVCALTALCIDKY